MAKKANITNKIKDKMATTWGLVISAATLFSLGFGSGIYISSVLSIIEQNDLQMKHYMDVVEQRSAYDEKIHELRETIFSLEKEILTHGRK